MIVVVEGVDNSGKSTLIKALQVILPGYGLQGSEGPPKYRGEMDDRVTSYLRNTDKMIYDRHPCVSQPIYGMMRSHSDPIHPRLLESFYRQRPLFIYCDGGDRGMFGHTHNPESGDTQEHLDAVNENYVKLLAAYRVWAGQHAFISYRIGDSISRVCKTVESLVSQGRL